MTTGWMPWWTAAIVVGLVGCHVDSPNLEGLRCPCVDGWFCDDATGLCVRALPDRDAAIPDAAIERDGGGSDAGDAGASDQDAGGDHDAGPIDPYRDEVLADRPLAYWRLDETEAPIAHDSSGNAIDGTYRGGVSLGAQGVVPTDAAAGFDGVDDDVDLGDRFDFAGMQPFSLEVWVRPFELDGVILAKSRYVEGEGYVGYLLTVHVNGGRVVFDRTPGYEVAGPTPALGDYTHVVVTFDGVTLLLYVDGAQVDSTMPDTELADTDAPFQIDGQADWGRLEASIDEVAVYDRALSAARVAAHYAAAAP